MPFREKIAWIALLGIIGVSGYYFGLLALHPHAGHRYFVGTLAIAILAQIGITMAATIVVAATSPAEAGAALDERDRLVAVRAAGRAYYVLLIGGVCAAASIHLGFGVFGMLNALLAVIMSAEAVRFALQIAAYRRGG